MLAGEALSYNMKRRTFWSPLLTICMFLERHNLMCSPIVSSNDLCVRCLGVYQRSLSRVHAVGASMCSKKKLSYPTCCR